MAQSAMLGLDGMSGHPSDAKQRLPNLRPLNPFAQFGIFFVGRQHLGFGVALSVEFKHFEILAPESPRRGVWIGGQISSRGSFARRRDHT